jgi:hypothetical protein
MNYTPYPTKKALPSRLSRKQSRNTIFMKNKKAKSLLLKQKRKIRLEATAS